MVDINFYHVTALPLNKALPRLLEKVHKAGHSVLVLTENQQQTQQINEDLWSYTTKYFLPHGTAEEPYPEEQPIFLSHEEDNRNNASILAYIGRAEPKAIAGYNKCLYMFDGNDATMVQHARAQWKQLKEDGHQLVYWQQSKKGAWEEGART